MKNYNKKIIIALISIVFVLFVVLSISYAYFATQISNVANTNLNANVTIANALYNITTTEPAKIGFSVTYDDMKYTDSGLDAYVGDQKSYTVNLLANNADTNVLCTYDVIWIWDGTDQYLTPTNTLPFTAGDITYTKEFTITGTSTTTGDATNDYSTNIIPETNLSDFTWSLTEAEEGNTATLLSNAKIGHNGVGNTSTTWTFTVKVYNIYANQNELINKDYQAHIEIQNINCSAVN